MFWFAVKHPWLTLLEISGALDWRRVECAVPAVGMDDAIPCLEAVEVAA